MELRQLNDIINIKPASGLEKIIATLSSRFFFIYKSKDIINENKQKLIKGPETETINIPVYAGENEAVKSMISFLRANLINDIYGAYIHGSLATDEEISYSDFDALVIIKDEVFESKQRFIRVCHKLKAAQKIIYNYDALQHHGWFVLCETDIKNFPVTFFPLQLFTYSKSLLHEQGTKLVINYDSKNADYKSPFYVLANSLEKKLSANFKIKNAYQLKSVLSEFMLIPAFFYQAKNSKGIYKKFSFQESKKYFSENEWQIMDKVSAIRLNWKKPELPNYFLKKLFTSPNYFGRTVVKKLPFFFHNKNIDSETQNQMLAFVRSMLIKLNIKA